MRRPLRSALALSMLALAPEVAAQTASALLVEDGALPGAPGQTVFSLNNAAVNQVGGYAVSVNADDGSTTISHVWGSASGGPGTVLRSETTVGNLQQTSFESFYGISDSGQVAYSPSANDLMSGTTGLDGVWLDDTVIAIEEDPVPGQPGQFWSFGSRPGVTADGMPYWVGGITSTAGGSTQNRGLFLGASASVLYQGGLAVPGLPLALSTSNTVSFDYRLSAKGTHSIAEAQMAGASSTNDNAMVLSGAGLLVDGALVREGDPVPAASGGLPGENWDNFDSVGVTEGGSWFFTGDTDGATTTDEVVVVDGTIVLREGDVLGGQTLAGAIEGAARNEDGDLAVIWDVATGEEVLVFNGRIVLSEGDAVDFDGDGSAEPGSLLADFTGIGSIAVGARDQLGRTDVYFTADVDFNGTSTSSDDLEGFFRLRLRGGPPTGGAVADRTGPVMALAGPGADNVHFASDLENTWFTVTPPDRTGADGGRGSFARSYLPDTVVTFTAPPWAEGKLFAGWRVDDRTIATQAPLTLSITGETSIEPLYLDVGRAR